MVQIEVSSADGTLLETVFSDLTGHFEAEVPVHSGYSLKAYKDMFEEQLTELTVDSEGAGDKLYVKLEMKRAPGYLFEITLADKKEEGQLNANAISGAWIEVYNNTKKQEVLSLKDYPQPQFNVSLEKGNHYTILVRKDGYISKRMEAFVDIDDCILCFEGVGSVEPGVSDNLSEGNQIGVLLANVELDKIYEGKTIPISNILYGSASAELDKTDEKGLLALATLMSDNPDIIVEIGSHTDSRGSQEANLELSRERAKNVIEYLVDNRVSMERLVSKGYGESKLLNDCPSFSDCTERQHAINRRTELKVLGVASIKTPKKTLAQMKLMEQSKALMEEIQFGGQIKVPEDATLEQLDSLSSQQNAKGSVQDLPPSRGSAAQVSDVESVVDTSADSEGPSTIYKILIKESEVSLGFDDLLYQNHSNLIEIEQGEVFHYVIGTFKSMMAADNFHKSYVLKAYPDSKILTIVDGVIQ